MKLSPEPRILARKWSGKIKMHHVMPTDKGFPQPFPERTLSGICRVCVIAARAS